MYLFDARDDGGHGRARCKPLSHSLSLCLVDIFAILAVAVLVWYIVWGIPLTIRLVNWYKTKLAARRRARSLKKLRLLNDIECSAEKKCSNSPKLPAGARLRNYIANIRQPTKPEPIYHRNGGPIVIVHEKIETDASAPRVRFSDAEGLLPLPRPMSALVCSISELLAAPLSPGASSMQFSSSSLYSLDAHSPDCSVLLPPPAYLDFHSTDGKDRSHIC